MTCSAGPVVGTCNGALAVPVVSVIAVTVTFPIVNEIGMPTRGSPHGTRPSTSAWSVACCQ